MEVKQGFTTAKEREGHFRWEREWELETEGKKIFQGYSEILVFELKKRAVSGENNTRTADYTRI